MRKLFKKSLACLLAAIFCVTLCVAAVPASAEGLTFSTNDVEAKAGATDVVINFEIDNFTNVIGAHLKFDLPSVVSDVTSVVVNNDTTILAYNPDNGNGNYKVTKADGKPINIMFLGLFGAEFKELASADKLTFAITVTIADSAKEGTYEYGTPYFGVVEAENDSELAAVSGEFGTFEIVPAVTEPTLDASVTFTPMLYYQDKVGVLFYTKHAETNAYDDYSITVTYQKYDGDYNLYDDSKTYSSSEATDINGNPRDYFYFTELAIYEVNIPVTLRIDLIRDGAVVAYNEITTSVAQLTKESLIKYEAYASAMADTFASYLDMINYASQAQTYFASLNVGSDLDKNPLAKEGFEDYQKYASTDEDVPALDTLNKKKVIDKKDSSTDMKVMLQITASSSAYIRVKVGSHALENCTVAVSYTDSYNEVQPETINLADIKLDDSGYYSFPFAKVAVYDLNKDISIVLKDGDTELINTTFCLEYDINTYLTTYATAAPELSKLGKCALLFDRSAYKALFYESK